MAVAYARVIAPERRDPQQIVDDPGGDQEAHAQRHRASRSDAGDVRVDQVHAAREVVDDDEQGDAAHPGEGGLPLEPVQHLRQLARAEPPHLDLVEVPAVHHPQLAFHALARLLGHGDVAVEPHEVERGADPPDGDHQVEPAEGKVEPVENGRVHSATQCKPSRSAAARPPRRGRRAATPMAARTKRPQKARRVLKSEAATAMR